MSTTATLDDASARAARARPGAVVPHRRAGRRRPARPPTTGCSARSSERSSPRPRPTRSRSSPSCWSRSAPQSAAARTSRSRRPATIRMSSAARRGIRAPGRAIMGSRAQGDLRGRPDTPSERILTGLTAARAWCGRCATRRPRPRDHRPAAVGARAGVRSRPEIRRPGDLDALANAAHERNATLNYRSVLARELTAKDARLYLMARQVRRSRRPTSDGGGANSV